MRQEKRPDEAMSDQIILGQYEILERLADGKQVSAFRVRDALQGQEMLLKEFCNAPGGALLQEMESRAKQAMGLSHPGLVAVKKWVEGDRQAYVLRDFAPGKTLDAVLKENPRGWSPADARDLLLQICEAVGYIHDVTGQGHYGLHPGNIFIAEDGKAQVGDYGSSAAAKTGKEELQAYIVPKGAPMPEDATKSKEDLQAYIAPECLAAGGAPDTRADIYSLGALLYRLLTGRAPGEAGAEPPAWFEESGIAKLLANSLKREARERYTGVKGFAEDLKAVLMPPQLSLFVEGTNAPIPRGEAHHVRVKVENRGQAKLRVAGISASAEWVRRISPARLDLGGEESQEVSLILDTSRLPAGPNEARITLRSNAFGAETASFPVTIDILSPFVKAVPASLNFLKQAGKSQAQQIMASRSDGRSLKAQVEVSGPWIRCSKVLDTGNAQMFNVTVDATGLPAGIHRGTLTLKDADPFEVKSVQIPVVVMVEAPVALQPVPATAQPPAEEKSAAPAHEPPPLPAALPAAVPPAIEPPSQAVPGAVEGTTKPEPRKPFWKRIFKRKADKGPKKARPKPPPIAGGAPRGGLVPRLFARVIDTLVLVALSYGIGTGVLNAAHRHFVPDPLGFLRLPYDIIRLSRQMPGDLPDLTIRALLGLVSSPQWWVGLWLTGVYYIFTTSTWGKTLGKSLMKLKVVHRTGEKLTSRQALLRWLGCHLSEITLGLGYLPALFRTRRGLHDRLSGSYVAADDKEQKNRPQLPSGSEDIETNIGHYNEVTKDVLLRRNTRG
ncbi:MAG: RDD family protein [Armatimonadetes bacterium]|nr:RDD family protein [Armatimonadota bacterium]